MAARSKSKKKAATVVEARSSEKKSAGNRSVSKTQNKSPENKPAKKKKAVKYSRKPVAAETTPQVVAIPPIMLTNDPMPATPNLAITEGTAYLERILQAPPLTELVDPKTVLSRTASPAPSEPVSPESISLHPFELTLLEPIPV